MADDNPFAQFKQAAPATPEANPFEQFKQAAPVAPKVVDAPPKNLEPAPNPFESFLKPVKNVASDYSRRVKEAEKGFKTDFTQPMMKNPFLGFAARAGSVVGHAMDYVGAGPTAAATGIVGTPVETATKGKIPKETTGDIVSMAAPIAGEAKAAREAALAARALKAGTATAEQTRSAMKALKPAEKIFSPATVDDNAKASAALHRSVMGRRGIEADKAAYELGRHQRVVGNASPADQLNLIKYVEAPDTSGIKLSPGMQKAADSIRKVAQSYRKQIEYVMGDDGPSFIKDYYVHMWKQKPEEVESVLHQTGKQGSGGNLKRRTVPTYEEGLAAGLTPKYANPLDAMTAYTDNMAKFLSTHEILDGMEKTGLAERFPRGGQPHGWVPLEGIKTRTPEKIVMKDGEAVARHPEKLLYAPEGAARVYNNNLSKGMDSGDLAPVYRGARAVANGLVQAKLGLSAFHGAVVGQEGMVSQMARGIQKLSRGQVSGVKDIVTSPAAPVVTALRGKLMKDQILGKAPVSEMDKKLNDLYERTGNRLGMDKIYATRRGTSLLSSAIRGTFQRDLKDAAGAMTKGSVLERGKGAVDLAGNIIQSTASPLFEMYIPSMKRGAWAQQMSDYLKANPNATEAEQMKYGQRFSDNIDNRFGEVVGNNNFWNKTGYQIAQLLLLSPSWNLGTVREIGGGMIQIPESLKGLVKGKGVTDKTAYVGALVGTTMMQNAVATYLHTGQMPTGMDYFAYRTGGTDPSGQPERAMIPSYMKDVLAFTMNDPRQEVQNKLNPELKSAYELWNNRDYKNQPIYNPNGDIKEQAGEVGEYALDAATPISLGQSNKAKTGSGLNPFERFVGIRPAPRYITDPEGVKAKKEKYGRRDWKAKQRTDAKMQGQYEP
jgi:hypothetical protein